VNIYEPRRDEPPVGVNCLGRARTVEGGFNGDDASVADTDVSRAFGGTSAVNDFATSDDGVEHDPSILWP
jgi:hypothetical protein